MAWPGWLEEAHKLYGQLVDTVHDPDSKIWSQVHDIMQKIQHIHIKTSGMNYLSPNEINKILLQQKQFWLTSNNNIENTLKSLIFYGNHSRNTRWVDLCNIKSVQTRQHWMLQILLLINNRCMTFEKYDCSPLDRLLDSLSCILLLPFMPDFAHLLKTSDYECMFWNFFMCFHTTESEWSLPKTEMGFFMIFAKDYIENMFSNKTEKELQAQIVLNSRVVDFDVDVDAIQLSKKIIMWRNNVESYGRLLMDTGLSDLEQKPSLILHCGNKVYLYAKIHYKSQEYFSAKLAFIHAIFDAESFVIMAVSLEYVSKLCKYFSEYAIGLRCLKRAYKLCCMDNDTFIS
eukprot:403614_1